jgi:hypothetical protein
MGGRLLEGPTVAGRTSDWKEELGRFLKPFLDRLGHKDHRGDARIVENDSAASSGVSNPAKVGASLGRNLFRPLAF